VMVRAPDARFLAFFVPGPERFAWAAEAWAEVCSLSALECLPEVDQAIADARRAGKRVDGGEDPHWNATGHEIAARTILELLRRGPTTVRGRRSSG
jgi:hypothetical protein